MSPGPAATQVLNPLVDPPTNHKSLHCIESDEEPQRVKKIHLSGSFNSKNQHHQSDLPDVKPDVVVSLSSRGGGKASSSPSLSNCRTRSIATTAATTISTLRSLKDPATTTTTITTETTTITTETTTTSAAATTICRPPIVVKTEAQSSSLPIGAHCGGKEAPTAYTKPTAIKMEYPPVTQQTTERVPETTDGMTMMTTGHATPTNNSGTGHCSDAPPKPDSSSANVGGSSSSSSLKQPIKHFVHLKERYHNELTYMSLEFEKLEQQLLGARKTEESAGSRERREKLHSFIIHLTDTLQQIEAGVQQEASSGSVASTGAATVTESIDDGSKHSQDHEDVVHKLEEHIIANLLPVKVRLKKQLEAQQGAKHNPAGMPHTSGWNHRSDTGEKGMFAAAAEKKRIHGAGRLFLLEPTAPAQPVEPHQPRFGKPLDTGGSCVTKKLHRQMLGIKNEGTNDEIKPLSVEASEQSGPTRYYAGMALGSDHMKSSVTAASSVHKLLVWDTKVILKASLRPCDPKPETKQEVVVASQPPLPPPPPPPPKVTEKAKPLVEQMQDILQKFEVEPYPDIEDMERRRRRRRQRQRQRQRQRRRRCRKRQLRQDKESQITKAEALMVQEKKFRQVKKYRGPRQVEYICALCNELYNSTCDGNPWWALTQHELPKCHKTQIPRVDIGSPANAIKYHPALLAHLDENGGAVSQNSAMATEIKTVASVPPVEVPLGDTLSLGSDVSSGLEEVSADDDASLDLESDCDDSYAMTPAEKAENKSFGASYVGPKLDDNDASKLLILMVLASTCTDRHPSEEQNKVCHSIRWIMLHFRDCPGTTATGDICPFPWCRKVKHLLYHLVSCLDQDKCKICAGNNVSSAFRRLRERNEQCLKKCRERLLQYRDNHEGLLHAASSRQPFDNASNCEGLLLCRIAAADDVGHKDQKYPHNPTKSNNRCTLNILGFTSLRDSSLWGSRVMVAETRNLRSCTGRRTSTANNPVDEILPGPLPFWSPEDDDRKSLLRHVWGS